MVIYDSGDSSNLVTALESNLSGAKQIFDHLSKGSQHLIGVIDSGTLSGAAYTAGQTLFVAYINPMLQKLNQAIADIQGDLKLPLRLPCYGGRLPNLIMVHWSL